MFNRYGAHAGVLVIAVFLSGYATIDRHLPASLTLRLGAVNAQGLFLGQGGEVGQVSLGRAGAIVTAVGVPTTSVASHLATVHVVGAGEDLAAIAGRFGLTADQLKWSNPALWGSEALHSGDRLLLPPVPGVVYTMQPGDTLGHIAALFRTDVQTIADYNYLRSPGDPAPGTRLVIPGATGADVNHFPYGQCTWYVASRRSVPWFGNAGSWLVSAQLDGWPTGSKPAPGAIMVSWDSYLGHVGIVESVAADGSFVVAEMNYQGLGVIDRRRVLPGRGVIQGFIY